MSRYQRQDYLRATIQPWEGSGDKGMKPRPHNYLNLLKQFDSWIYAASMYNARGVASQSLKLYARKPRVAKKSNFPTREVKRSKMAYLSGECELKPSKGVMTAMGHNADVEEVLEHPVLDVLKSPTPFMSGYDLSVLRMLNLQLTGNCYMHPIFNQAGVPAELWNVPSQWTGVVPDRETNMVGGYVYGQQPSLIRFKLDEILHNKLPNPHDEFYGIGWVEAAADAATLLRKMDAYEHALFEHHARPDWGLFLNENLTDKQYERIENQINTKLKGNKKSGKPFLFEGGIDAKPLQWTPRDLAFDSGEMRKIENIAAISGVPVSMLKANDPNLASAREGNLGWLRNTIQPYCVSDEEYLNRTFVSLFGNFGESLFLAYDNPVPSDKLSESQLFVQEIQAGIRTRNEVRVELGLEPIEGGDELLIPSGLVPVSQAGQMPQMGGMPQMGKPQQQLPLKNETPKQPELNVEGQERFDAANKNKSLIPDIVKSCQRGELPRDAAIAQCRIVGGLTKEEAVAVVGSAGKKSATEAYFGTPEEAEEFGKRLGLIGYHIMEVDGETYYMAGENHEEWVAFQMAQHANAEKGMKAGFQDAQSRDSGTGRWSDAGGVERDSSGGNRRLKEGELTRKETKALAERLIFDGGFTYNPIDHTFPTEGLAVSTYPDQEEILQWSDNPNTAKDDNSNLRIKIRSFVKKNFEEFKKNKRAHFGGWHDKETGQIYLDMSTIVKSQKEAEKLSRQHNQEAYFNLGTFETIRVGHRNDGSKPKKEPTEIGASAI